MKILVFSDSHGIHSNIIEAVEAHKANVGLMIHLGDGTRDMEYVSALYPQLPCIMISGNSESHTGEVRVLELEGVRIMCMHGHSHGVKGSRFSAARAAADADASLLLYGHTHVPDDSFIELDGGRKIHLFNPGSITLSYPPSYGVITVSGGNVISSHGVIEG